MKKFIRFPKIGQYRQVVEQIVNTSNFAGLDKNGIPIYDETKVKPTLQFLGNCKLHGSLGAISYHVDEGIWAQSKEQIITPQNDNHGFAFFVESNKDVFLKLFEKRLSVRKNEILTIFGEWIGKSIQKGVAISNMDKSFVIFAIKSTQLLPNSKDEVRWYRNREFNLIKSPENRIYNILDYPTWEININFNNPKSVQDQMIEITNSVEKECPFAKTFGISGIGEGVVYTSTTSKFGTLRFKVKGEKHSGKTKKTKDRVAVDPIKMKSIEDFVNYAVHEDRLEQGLDKIFLSKGKMIDIKKLGDYLKWIVNDIMEEMDVLKKSDLEEAKKWFIDLFQGCYLKKLDKHPDRIFWIYDKNLVRQRKLSKITGIEKINLEMSDGELIFEQDEKNGWFWIKYSNYWSFLHSNFKLNDDEIRELTSSVVNEVLNCKQFTITFKFRSYYFWVNEVLNCKQFTIRCCRWYLHFLGE
jgi:hypothetical protein